MKQAVVTIKYEEEKLNAIKQYMGKKDADFESEMNEVLGKMYEKYVPQAVREYIDSSTYRLYIGEFNNENRQKIHSVN